MYLDPDSLYPDLYTWYMDLNTMGDQNKRANRLTLVKKGFIKQ
jgi:hypothetical protein